MADTARAEAAAAKQRSAGWEQALEEELQRKAEASVPSAAEGERHEAVIATLQAEVRRRGTHFPS